MGQRFFRLLDGQLQHLREHCSHANRTFHLDQLVVAHLIAFFNPILNGLRKIEDVFELPAVRKKLKMPRVPKSTLADAQRLFDPELLIPLFESLKKRAGIQEHDHRLNGVANKLLAVDGSFFAVASRIAWALYNHSAKNNITQPLRLVEIAQPGKPDQPLRLLTNRFDLSAEIIGVIYRHRWQVELFFRWLKCMANFQHFYSESQRGMTLQIYIAMIGTLLIAIETGEKPSSYDFALMSMAIAGMAPMDQILAQSAKRRAERKRAAERRRTKKIAG